MDNMDKVSSISCAKFQWKFSQRIIMQLTKQQITLLLVGIASLKDFNILQCCVVAVYYTIFFSIVYTAWVPNDRKLYHNPTIIPPMPMGVVVNYKYQDYIRIKTPKKDFNSNLLSHLVLTVNRSPVPQHIPKTYGRLIVSYCVI